MNPIYLSCPHIELVSGFDQLLSTKFHDQVNALCWERPLQGDFNEIVSKLQLQDNITEVSIEDLIQLDLSVAGQQARSIILHDLQRLTQYGASPVLNLLKCYERDDELGFISTDVYSFHVDRSPVATDTFLCTYHGAASDLIANDQVQQKILIPEIRQQLQALYDGPESGFENFLSEYYFDLHYQALAHAQPINLGQGHIWKLAVDHPEQKVLPCVHRAPVEHHGEYRLLLIC